jgi:hypothetical protein
LLDASITCHISVYPDVIPALDLFLIGDNDLPALLVAFGRKAIIEPEYPASGKTFLIARFSPFGVGDLRVAVGDFKSDFRVIAVTRCIKELGERCARHGGDLRIERVYAGVRLRYGNSHIV